MTLMLHAGANPVEYDALRALETPPATATHVPIPHFRVVDLIAHKLWLPRPPDCRAKLWAYAGRHALLRMVGLGSSHDRSRVIGVQKIADVLKQWEEPECGCATRRAGVC